MGFLESLTWYVWNWGIYGRSTSGTGYAMLAGWPGLFFDDDNGYMTNELMFVLLGVDGGGYNTTYPIEY